MTQLCRVCAHPIGAIPGCPVQSIIRAVADYYGITITDLLSDRRTVEVVRPRQIVMYLARLLTTQSLPRIGARLNHRDHTTVLHGVRRIKAMKASDPVLAGDVARLQNFLSGWIT